MPHLGACRGGTGTCRIFNIVYIGDLEEKTREIYLSKSSMDERRPTELGHRHRDFWLTPKAMSNAASAKQGRACPASVSFHLALASLNLDCETSSQTCEEAWSQTRLPLDA